ncbi:glycosyltransferase family 4 protein [Flavobacterium hiemivividum]|jgi:glycosyltransferase involved in cell wall biosynthesis|uniref:Glycosyltransferase n=1 Tax=Flavobacterium hiemivividum TaxID=2541734 RepID=A0A4R5CPL2_9FLAO|nr:glycosyltransferase family 4 protein [Flavobacterium hiemivividum]TDE02399.1 glycosyltransferase [Flavobacterium hiemivividum]
MKILHISGAKGWGGNEQQMIYCIPELEKLGCENVVFGVRNSVLEKECLLKNITFIPTKGSKLKNYKNFSYLQSIVNEFNPNIIHLHTSNSLTFYVLSDLWYNFKIKCVFSKKAMSASSSFLSKYKYNYSGINSILCVSKTVKDNFSNVLSKRNKQKAVVIHDCVSMGILNVKSEVNLRERYSIATDKKLIGNIANHTDAKDLITFIDVVDYLVNSLNKKDVVFFQIGEFTKLTAKFESIVKERKLEDYIIFTAKIVNAFSLNSQFDVFLMTSQREGGPTSVLEAMLIGVPVVSTYVGVVPDVIENGVNGYSSKVKDFSDLATKIKMLLESENLEKEFVTRSRDIIQKRFTASIIAEETVRHYEKLFSV